MSAVREALVEESSAPTRLRAREWSLPVLYVRGVAPFSFPQADRRTSVAARGRGVQEARGHRRAVARRSGRVPARRGAAGRHCGRAPRSPRPFWPEMDGTWSPEAVAPPPAAPVVPRSTVVEGGQLMADEFDGEPPDAKLRADAWCGEGAHGAAGDDRRRWSVRSPTSYKREGPWRPSPVDPANWQHPEVGWGVVLPDATTSRHAEKARGDDAPDPIRSSLPTAATHRCSAIAPTSATASCAAYDAQGTRLRPELRRATAGWARRRFPATC